MIKIYLILVAVTLFAFANSPVFGQKISALSPEQTKDTGILNPQANYVQANGIRIHYLEWNKTGNLTIILLHGLYDSADTWLKVAPLLARGYRVIAPDRRGAGRSDKPEYGYDYKTLAQDVLSLMNRLKLRRVHLIGHSAGAGVALTASAIKRSKISAVVLIDGGFWPKQIGASATEQRPCDGKAADCRRLFAIERGNEDYNAEMLYAKISVRTLLVMAVPPKAEAEQFADQLREAQSHVEKVVTKKLRFGKMQIISETSHWVQLDQPNKLAFVIENFIK